MRPLLLVVAIAGAAALAAAPAQAQDRYGSEQASDQTVATLDGPHLIWPGKQTPPDVEPTARPPEPAVEPPPMAEPPAAPEQPAAQFVAPPLPAPAPLAVEELPPPAPVQPAPAVVAEQPAPPPAAPADVTPGVPAQTAEAAGAARLPPHIYSVARQYGLQPDPIPLPQQFFADQGGADLAAPPAALPPRPVPGAQTVNNPNTANTPSNRARAIAEDTPSPDDVSADGVNPNDASVN